MPDEMIQVFHICMRLQTNGQEKKRIGIRINTPKICKPGKCRSLFHLTFPQYILSTPNLFFFQPRSYLKLSASLPQNFMQGLSFISFPSVHMQGSLRQIMIRTVYHSHF